MPAVSVQVILCITLRLLAGARYLDLFWSDNVGGLTIFEIFPECLRAPDLTLDMIVFPGPEEEFLCVTETYIVPRKVLPIKGVISSLNGLAIKIEQPFDVVNQRKYENIKSIWAIVIQASCTANNRFTFLSLPHAGITHGSTALKRSGMHILMCSKKLPCWSIVVCGNASSVKTVLGADFHFTAFQWYFEIFRPQLPSLFEIESRRRTIDGQKCRH